MSFIPELFYVVLQIFGYPLLGRNFQPIQKDKIKCLHENELKEQDNKNVAQ